MLIWDSQFSGSNDPYVGRRLVALSFPPPACSPPGRLGPAAHANFSAKEPRQQRQFCGFGALHKAFHQCFLSQMLVNFTFSPSLPLSVSHQSPEKLLGLSPSSGTLPRLLSLWVKKHRVRMSMNTPQATKSIPKPTLQMKGAN